MSTEYYEEVFEVSTPANLEVSNVRGPVSIKEGDSDKILVKATKYLNTGEAESTIVEITQRKDGTVEAKTEFPKKGWGIRNKPCKVEYEITTPKSCSVLIKTINSSLEILGLEGEFKLNSVNGAIKLEDLTGEFILKSVNGKVRAKNLTGSAQLNSVNGTIKILESNIPSIQSKSVNGKVILQSPLGEGPYDINSVSGTVKLVVPDDTNCTIEAKSVSGGLKTDLPTSRYAKNSGRIFAELGSGGTQINMKSVSGGLYIVTDLESKGSSLSEKFKVNSKEERLDILTKLEKGESTIEETLKELSI